MDGDNIIALSTEPKRVLITGCSRGLGRAMVEEFTARGDTVVGCARSEGEVEKLKKEYKGAHQFHRVDVADDEAVKAFCDEIVEEMGVPNLVLNNAALINQNASLWKVPAEEFNRLMDVNVKGTVSLIRHILPHMLVIDKPGVIVNFSSYWGRSTAPEVAPYCATKWAIEGLTQALSQELPPHLGAVAFNPGIIHTDMLESCFGPNAANYHSPQDWARSAVPFLANLAPHDNGKALTMP